MERFDDEKIKGHLVKVKYSFDRINQREGTATVGLIIGVILLILSIYFMFDNPRSLHNDIVVLLWATFLFIITIPTIIHERKKRMEQKHEHEKAVMGGKKVIGTIVDLINVSLQDIGVDDRSFRYSIEYEDDDSDNDGVISVQTPPAITENMHITAKDLPLKAVVYIFKNKGYIDAVVDPPIIKMTTRHLVRKWPLILILLCLILCIVFYNLDLIPIAGACYIVGAITLILYIRIWQIRRKK
jgi:membrane protein YdbS with pleckstrin-like domain